MASGLLQYKRSAVSYSILGRGPRPILCFHGFGESASLYSFLVDNEANSFTFICIDLPFHGKTEWRELLCTGDDLLTIIDDLFSLKELQSLRGKPLFLMGNSLGARVALSIYEARPAAFCRLILLAPDGLRVNPWYWLATQTRVGNRLFSLTMDRPGWFFGLINLLQKCGLANESVTRFVKSYIGDKTARRVLYDRWISLRKLRPSLSRIKRYIRTNKTEVRLLYGKFDRIILPKRGRQFCDGIEEYCSITILDGGHSIVQPKFIAEIRKAMLQ
ncbi:MAG TPA: alpha/beta hydrolase [Chitinophagaceae bacterium]|nr:alpha/beta hydrolase [Chitinophagaceae bacterium]